MALAMSEETADKLVDMTQITSPTESELERAGGALAQPTMKPVESPAEGEVTLGTMHETGVRRGLKSRHIQLIALGGE